MKENICTGFDYITKHTSRFLECNKPITCIFKTSDSNSTK